MERLETKRIHGRTYYYYSKWEWRDGKCRRVWQKYLGKLEDIIRAVEEGGPRPRYAEVFQWGLSEALWQECCRAKVCDLVNRHIRKRDQGLTTGAYVAIAALNRAMQVRSKRSLWHWFAATTLLRHPARGRQDERRQTVLSKRNELQDRLLVLLGLSEGCARRKP